MAIPYPFDWERHLVLHGDWRVYVRPVPPDDEANIKNILNHVTAGHLRLRFCAAIKDFSHPFLARIPGAATHFDNAQVVAFIAFDEISHEPLCVVRIMAMRH